MPDWTGMWSKAEATAYLEDATVPVRLACRTPNGGLWMLSLWFRYDDGAIHCATSADADVVSYLESNPSVAFEISDNQPPYRGVRGAGTAAIDPDEDKELLLSLFERYLGGTDNDLADRLLVEGREETRIRVDPTKCYTWDFGDRMSDAVE
jgi:nitroimidazol reductase NimA-like FMN-containing flavoprotein (pyridoxamine 5'-phosphate oxidase superfamily)